MTRPVQQPAVDRLLAEHARRISNLERKRPDVAPLTLPEEEVSGLSTDFVLASIGATGDPGLTGQVLFDPSDGSGTAVPQPGSGDPQLTIVEAGLYAVTIQMEFTCASTLLDGIGFTFSDSENYLFPQAQVTGSLHENYTGGSPAGSFFGRLSYANTLRLTIVPDDVTGVAFGLDPTETDDWLALGYIRIQKIGD